MDEVLVTVLLHGAREVTAAAAGGVLKRSLRQPLARDCTVGMILPDVITLRHGGELATKVGYFGVKSTNVLREQMGTKPAKLGRLQSLGVNSAKVRRFCATKTSPPPPQGLRSVGGPKLLKWGLSGRGSNLLQ